MVLLCTYAHTASHLRDEGFDMRNSAHIWIVTSMQTRGLAPLYTHETTSHICVGIQSLTRLGLIVRSHTEGMPLAAGRFEAKTVPAHENMLN